MVVRVGVNELIAGAGVVAAEVDEAHHAELREGPAGEGPGGGVVGGPGELGGGAVVVGVAEPHVESPFDGEQAPTFFAGASLSEVFLRRTDINALEIFGTAGDARK